MELRPGYKQTDIGVVPEDWETLAMIDAAPKIIDYRGRTPRKLGMDWGGGDIPALSARNVKMGFIDFDEECNLGSESLYKRWMTNGDVARDDIVFTTEAPLGNVALIPDDQRYILSQRTILLKVDSVRVYSPFLFQLMLSDRFQQLLGENASGSTAQGIQRKKFETLRIACPPVVEQRAIAAALSDTDALLAGLDRLVAKKRDLKQAAMQQLLTGQTRLPRFHGQWTVKRLGDVAEFCPGAYLAGDRYCFGGFEVQGAGGVMGHHDVPNFPEPITVIGRVGTVGKPRFFYKGCWVNNNAGAMVALQACAAPEFLHLLLLTVDWSKVVSVTAQPFLVVADLLGLDFPMPELPEQVAIAAVISDMDAELTALEARRNKTRELKQGMMQELLTGRTRLV